MVGISLLTLVPGIFGGTETYARELTRALSRVGTLDYRVFVPTIAPDAGDGLPTKPVSAYHASRTTIGRLGAMGLASVGLGVRRQLELDSLAALHFPLSIMMPPVRKPASVTTVHDVLDKLRPEAFPRAERAYRKVVYSWTARLSRLIIVHSQHAKEVYAAGAGIDPGRIRVIPLGIDRNVFTPGDETREPFLLYPADAWPHKNHDRLLEAFGLLRRERPHLRLVLTGAGHERRPLPERVEYRGLVPPDELARLYRTASAMVFPSLHEAFGLPPLEAMASGCPVAVSNAGALPEVCGDAAVYFDPTSADEIAGAISTVLDRPNELVARGLERAKLFSWDECARRHEDVYKELIG
jgi:glycosyltransferase involved in cell wall biosynthesis